MQNSYISWRLGMLRKGSSASLEEDFPEERGILFIGPERSRWGLTHHDEFGLCVSRRVRATSLGEICGAICGAAVPHHSYRQEAGPARSARPPWGEAV